MTTTIIGLGLIGGSLALRLRASGMATKLIGVDHHAGHREEALRLGLVDETLPLAEATKAADLAILAIPVSACLQVLPDVLAWAGPNTTVVDMGSTKKDICILANQHPNRARFVASHPIAGTENSGPAAALPNLFDNKIGILCDTGRSAPDAVDLVTHLYTQVLRMKLTAMASDEHDLHIAYVSHLSHVSSFMLGITVLEKEKNEKNIFNMAGSGFESTVRLAKSSPDMWGPIFDQNAENLSEAVGAYIENLKAFKRMIDSRESGGLRQIMQEANEIRRVLDGINLRNTEALKKTTPRD